MNDLLIDLLTAERESAGELDCPLCVFINGLDDERTRAAMSAAAAGSIGLNKLAAVLKKHETGIGRRTIVRHRREDHQ